MGAVTCQTVHHTYKRNTDLWQMALCPIEAGQEWHDLKCIRGECERCGVHLIPVCDSEADPANEKLMDWRHFEKVVVGKTKQGEPKKVLRLEY